MFFTCFNALALFVTVVEFITLKAWHYNRYMVALKQIACGATSN